MAITYQGAGAVASHAAATGTTLAVAYPAPGGGILADDLLVLFAWNSNASFPQTPAGWTTGPTITSGGSTPSLKISIFKAVGGETGTLTVTFPGSNAAEAVMLAYRGVDATTPQDATATTFGISTAVTNIDVPTLTTTTTGVRLVGMASTNNATSTWTSPTGPAAWTERVDDHAFLSGTVGDLDWSGSGATGTMTFVQSGSVRSCGAVIALRPASAAVAADASFIYRRGPNYRR